ncbi:hypothetical protein CNY89_00750 [Amaricoccus sp. HAR-UPW-R2A-40]|nr:hypothetical protein CNY89_00750 [Amaricoccus sp. HAR-UPW-R2A-40]
MAAIRVAWSEASFFRTVAAWASTSICWTRPSVSTASAAARASPASGSAFLKASDAAISRLAGSGSISVSRDRAERMTRRTELLTLIASVERAATGPRSAPVSGSDPTALEPRPVTRMIAPSSLRWCNSPAPSASSSPAARGSPVAAMAATTSERSLKLPSGSCVARPSRVWDRAGVTQRASQRQMETRIRMDRPLNMERRAGRGPARRISGQLVAPPHWPVAVLKLPHCIGSRQTPTRSLDSGR